MSSSMNDTEPKLQWQITDDFIDSIKRTYKRSSSRYRSNSTEECLEVLKEQLLLRDSLHDLRLEVRALSGQVDTSKLQAHLDNAASGAEQLHCFINRRLNGDPLVNIPTNSSAVKAQQVFETAELAEMVLMKLDPCDILATLQVNKSLRAANQTLLSRRSKLDLAIEFRSGVTICLPCRTNDPILLLLARTPASRNPFIRRKRKDGHERSTAGF